MHRPLRILIIEDDRAIVRGLLLRLRAAGHDGLAAHDGAGGVAAAVATIPDAILLDLRLPDRDGLSVLLELQQHDLTRMIPVIVLSANVAERAKRDALIAGAHSFIEKPYEFRRLLATIERASHSLPPRAVEMTPGQ